MLGDGHGGECLGREGGSVREETITFTHRGSFEGFPVYLTDEDCPNCVCVYPWLDAPMEWWVTTVHWLRSRVAFMFGIFDPEIHECWMFTRVREMKTPVVRTYRYDD